jgi:hypothetical protein
MDQRLDLTTRWVLEQPGMSNLRLRCFGVPAQHESRRRWGERIGAVVSAGGHPDLAHDVLAHVTGPALFIMGDLDQLTFDLNKDAACQMQCANRLVVVAGASHLFEPGVVSEVGDLALDWFSQHCTPRRRLLSRPSREFTPRGLASHRVPSPPLNNLFEVLRSDSKRRLQCSRLRAC